MLTDESNPQITIVAPDAATVVPVYDMGTDEFDSFFTNPLPDLTFFNDNGSSSAGYSAPHTPELGLETSFSPMPDFDSGLSVMASVYSPSSLSPAFDGLTLEGASQGEDMFDKAILVSQQDSDLAQLLLTPEPQPSSSSSPSRLSLVIPSSPNPSLYDGYTPQGEDDWLSAMMQLNNLGHSPYIAPLNIQSGYLPPDVLSPESSGGMQRLTSRPMGMHARHTSEINTPWSGSSQSTTSPSLTFTPSEPSSGTSLADPWANEDYTLADAASVIRRHSDRGYLGPGRGRSEHRSPASSANSSRRSSPYPASRPSPCTEVVSPNQYEGMSHLAVPEVSGVGVRRRHSFNGASTGRSPVVGEMSMGVINYLDPSTSTGGRKVASQAGIKASAARRTKEAKFFCDICPQSFTTNHNLRNHRNVHLGIKEHFCTACGRPFTTQSVLARHKKTCRYANNASRDEPAGESQDGSTSVTELEH